MIHKDSLILIRIVLDSHYTGHYEMEWRRLLPNTRVREFGVCSGLSSLASSLESLRAKGFSRLNFLETDDMMVGLVGLSNMTCFMLAWSFSRSVSRMRMRATSSLSSRFSLRIDA
jgi:hypothetical protein